MRGKSHERERERDGLVKYILCVQRCKGFMDLMFCEIFSWYCGATLVY